MARGSQSAMLSRMKTQQKRFDAKTTPGANGCLEWTGSKYPSGYGEFYYDGRIQAAHRVAWLLAGHEIPDGMYVLHRCDNRGCVSVAHLFLGTHDDNMADMAAKGRDAKQDGEANPNARLTAAHVAEIRALKGKKSQADIVAAYAVSKTMIRRIT